MMEIDDLKNSPEYNLRNAIIGLIKLCAILGAALVIIAGLLILALSVVDDPDYEMKSWCNKYHSELSYSDCLDEAGV